MPNTFQLKLSENQDKALRNESINRKMFWLGALGGGAWFLSNWNKEKDDIPTLVLSTLGVAGTAHAVSSAFYPVRASDLLDFDKQTLQGLGATTNKSSGGASAGGADPYSSAFNLINTGISAFWGSETEREKTRQIEQQYQGQANVIKEQVKLESEENTGIVYQGVFDNLRAKGNVAQGSQQTTRFLTGASVVLGLGFLAYLAFAPKKEEETKTKKSKKDE